MSMKNNILALSAAGLLAVGAAFFAFAPSDPENISDNSQVAASAQTTATPAAATPSQTQVKPSATGDQSVAAAPQASQQQPSPAPKKLTRQQLMPPPATEAEKLEKAAQQESNF